MERMAVIKHRDIQNAIAEQDVPTLRTALALGRIDAEDLLDDLALAYPDQEFLWNNDMLALLLQYPGNLYNYIADEVSRFLDAYLRVYDESCNDPEIFEEMEEAHEVAMMYEIALHSASFRNLFIDVLQEEPDAADALVKIYPGMMPMFQQWSILV